MHDTTLHIGFAVVGVAAFVLFATLNFTHGGRTVEIEDAYYDQEFHYTVGQESFGLRISGGDKPAGQLLADEINRESSRLSAKAVDGDGDGELDATVVYGTMNVKRGSGVKPVVW